MRLLVLGGTRFLGRALVECALGRGHELTLFNRGQTNADLFPETERIRGDRTLDLSPLDGREWEFIHQHTVVGERILRASPVFRNAATVVRSSHERWDGTGYPDGLVGEEIPLASRIVSACDAFEAMTTPRPYRVARTTDDALEELRRCSGTQFDPRIVAVLVAVVRERVEAA